MTQRSTSGIIPPTKGRKNSKALSLQFVRFMPESSLDRLWEKQMSISKIQLQRFAEPFICPVFFPVLFYFAEINQTKTANRLLTVCGAF